MAEEPLTQEAGTALAAHAGPHAFLAIYIEGGDRSSRIVDLPDGVDVTFGRSRGATINVESEKVSRMHARVRRTGDTIEVEDLGSRNGTRVNGEKIEGPRRVAHGDEIQVGSILAVVGVASGLRRSSPVADDIAGEARLTAEVDRSVRYHRPLTVGLVRCANDAAIDAIARALRPMDMIAEDAGDDYLLILPELGRSEGHAAVERALDFARASGADARVSSALCPDDGTSVEMLISQLRAGLRTPRPARAPAAAAT
ncbi:MAG TPA: FHA domain-containing protein, partial [Kofleriaceae bacterium]|nr:FHA domain-containing protein [Kofleriaceae bacterium]